MKVIPSFLFFLALYSIGFSQSQAAPYPSSTVITDMTFDFSSHTREAEGSDNWPITWADDDHQYTSWGDGNGFTTESKRSLGVSRVEGNNVTGATKQDVWSGLSGTSDDGKSYGIISISGNLYMWVSPGSGSAGFQEQRVWKSSNHGVSWTKASWAFAKSDNLINPTFIQFGKDYAGARDEFVYIYANHVKTASLSVQKPGEIALLRVPKSSIMVRAEYEFFAGLDGTGNPIWTKDRGSRKPVFKDANGVGWNTSASYNAQLGRYLIATEHEKSLQGNLGIFDAPEPWGPWTTVKYVNGFGSSAGIAATTFFWNFSNKWLSADGKNFVLIFTGVGQGTNDSWNTVNGTFTIKNGPTIAPPKPPSDVTAD